MDIFVPTDKLKKLPDSYHNFFSFKKSQAFMWGFFILLIALSNDSFLNFVVNEIVNNNEIKILSSFHFLFIQGMFLGTIGAYLLGLLIYKSREIIVENVPLIKDYSFVQKSVRTTCNPLVV